MANVFRAVHSMILKLPLVLCWAVAAAYAADKQIGDLGFGYQFETSTQWKITHTDNSWELTQTGMPPIGVQWDPATSKNAELAHQKAVVGFIKGYNDKYRVTLRYALTKVTVSASGTKIYESELAAQFAGGSLQLHYYTLLLEGRLLSIVGARVNDASSVIDAWSLATSVQKASPYSVVGGRLAPGVRDSAGVTTVALVGKWWTEGPAYLIFAADGSVKEYTALDPYSPRRGNYKLEGGKLIFEWRASSLFKAEREECSIAFSASHFTLVHPGGVSVTYRHDSR